MRLLTPQGEACTIASRPGHDLAVATQYPVDFRQHVREGDRTARSEGKTAPLEDGVADLQRVVPGRVGYSVWPGPMEIEVIRPGPARRIGAGRNGVGGADSRQAPAMHVDQPKVATAGELGHAS